MRILAVRLGPKHLHASKQNRLDHLESNPINPKPFIRNPISSASSGLYHRSDAAALLLACMGAWYYHFGLEGR